MSIVQKLLVEFLDMPVVNIEDKDRDRNRQERDLDCYCCTRMRYCDKFQEFLVLRERLRKMKQLTLDSDIPKTKEEYKCLRLEMKKVRGDIWKCTRRRTLLFSLGYRTFRVGDVYGRW